MSYLLSACLFLTGVLLIYVGSRMMYLQCTSAKAKGSFWVERKLSQLILVLWCTYLITKIIIN